jgi:hypothetical protein
MQHLFGKRFHKPEPPHCRKDRKRKDDPCKRRLKKDCHKPHSRKKCD